MFRNVSRVSIVSLVLLGFCYGIPKTNPQFDIPPLNTPAGRQAATYGDYLTRHYSGGRLHNTADVDRNLRSGPPYASDGDNVDGVDDFRNGPNDEERVRYGYVYPQPGPPGYPGNFSQSSAFDSRSYYNDANLYNNDDKTLVNGRYASDIRYRNHNYDDLNSNFGDTYSPPFAGRLRGAHAQNPYSQEDRYTERGFNVTPFSYATDADGRGTGPLRPYENGIGANSDRYVEKERKAERQHFLQERRIQIETEKLRSFLLEAENGGSIACTTNVAAQWNFETNVNEHTQGEALRAQQHYAEFQRVVAEQAKAFNKDYIFDRHSYRQLMLLSDVGPHALPLEQLDRYNRIINEMLFIYNGASICAFQEPFHCNLHYIPQLKDIMAKSRDWRELQHTWLEYHRKAGHEMRDAYEQLIDVMNDVANVNNISNGGEYWFAAYESGNFREDLEIVWEQIRPLYEMLHAYARRKLREFYGPDLINRNAPLPSHILGNMFGQSWSNVLDIILPYPGRLTVDVTTAMLEQGYTPLLMFQLAEEFFTSINMSAVGPEFYHNSLFEPPLDRQVLCEPSAWDFCNRRDFRVKLCTEISQKGLLSVHHEMAHIQYFLHYRHLSKVFRNGANPAFHQAIGDAIGLSVATPKHFQTLNLLKRSVDDTRYDINYLFTMAADKIAFLPFALALDNWRYDLFSGHVHKKSLNCHFWDLREKYGGIKPPVLRSERDFDAGAKYHVPANIPYIKFFFSTVMQFQIYRAMCRAAGQYDPADSRKALHRCDIYRHPEAGNLLKQIMMKGSSQPWQEVLQEALGEGRLDGSALREYFAPLEEWLRLENLRNQEFVGWNYDGDYCRRSIETANLQIYGGYYSGAISPIKGRNRPMRIPLLISFQVLFFFYNFLPIAIKLLATFYRF